MSEQSSATRIDDRKPEDLRPVSFERGYTKHAAGSVLVSFGETKVICTATIEEHIPRWMADSGRGWITAEYAMLPGSSSERIRRDHTTRGRAQEISRLIGRSLRAIADLAALGERQIIIDCDVIQADGGTRTASITGGYVALHDACARLAAAGAIEHSPLTGQCAAISVGICNSVPLLDLCYAEDSAAGVDMNVVMRDNGDFIELQGSAEGHTFSRQEMNAMIDLAADGCTSLFKMQREALELG